MNISRRTLFALTATCAASALPTLTGCDNTPPRERLIEHIEAEGTAKDGGYALSIPFEEAPDVVTSFDSYDTIDCALVYDGESLALGVTRIPPAMAGGDLTASYVTVLTLPAEEEEPSTFAHSATMTILGTNYTSSGGGSVDLATFDSGTEIEFEQFTPPENDPSSGLQLEFEQTPGGSFVADTHADICSALTSLAAYLEEQKLGFTLADLGIEAYEEE